jgi:glycosyltransferase involved in cell wall biosynthesis
MRDDEKGPAVARSADPAFSDASAVAGDSREGLRGGVLKPAAMHGIVEAGQIEDRVLAAKELLRPYLRWGYYSLFPNQRPQWFIDCWKVPSHDVSWTPGEAAREPDLLFLPMNDWHARMQRSQQLAKAFAALGHRSIYVNPNLGCEYHRPYLADPTSRVSALEARVLEFHVHLPREHAHHRRLLTAKETQRIVREIRVLVGALGNRRAIQLMSFPIWLDAAKLLRDAFQFPIVYDCHDYLAGFQNVTPDIVGKEAETLETCDLAVFSSEHLLETTVAGTPELRKKSLVARNAVDASHFSGAACQSSNVVGYMGSLDHWFDVAAVERAARDHAGWRFRLIGRIEDQRVEQLRAYPNVELTSEAPYADLPALAREFRVALIPFLRTALTLAANPIKLYEYFSLGLPVVSARLPEVEKYQDLVYLADSPAEFSEQIAKAMHEDDPALRARRVAVAQRESWQARAVQLLEAFKAR